MSDSPGPPLSCPQCGAALPAEATAGLCPRCLMSQAMRPPPEEPAKSTKAAVPLPEDLAPHFPNYEILRILGRGGMGAVYLARQTSLNRLVAIKILPAELDDGENNFTQRFKNEAQAMAQLSHPGIVAVYDFGQTTSGLLFIVMEYIDGTDVALMVTRQGRLSSAHAMAITAHVCDALAYAHGKGIIHRDIKPSNIMIGNDGMVKVADFGLAKMSQAASSGLTQSGMVMGTLHFMAPEALMLGSEVDQRADIYAVGVMLYQMLTGKLPQGLFEMPSLQVRGLDPRYDQIVAKALREDRDLRYPDANAMRHDLDAILTQPVVKVAATAEKAPAALNTMARPQRPGGQPYRPPQRQEPVYVEKKPSFLPWVAVLLVIGLAAWFLFGRSEPAPEAMAAVEPSVPKAEPKADNSSTAMIPASSNPDAAASQIMTPPALLPISPDAAEFRRGLVSWWRADGDARDAAGNNHGALVGAASYTDGLFGKAFQFDGGYVEVPDSPSLQFGPDSKFTVTFWAYRTSESRPFHLFGKRSDKRGDTGGTKGFQLGFSAPTPQFALNEWVFWVVSYDGFKQTVYVNGEPKFMFGKITPGDAVPFRIGRSGDWESFKGRIDDMRIYDRAMTASEVISMFKTRDAKIETAVTPRATNTVPPFSATKEQPFVNSLGMKFVPVPITGGPTDGQGVLFSIWETRVKDYEVFAKEKQLTRTAPPYSELPDHPVVNVSFNDATAYCSWLTDRERKAGWLGTDEVYRLPSDHEWSCAVGIGDKENASQSPEAKSSKINGVYPWGTGYPPPAGVGNYHGEETEGDGGFPALKGYRDDFTGISPVGRFQANAIGLFDLGGNVWEFCADLYASSKPDRVMRGATFNNRSSRDLNASFRIGMPPADSGSDKGFRIVLATNKRTTSPVTPIPIVATDPSTNTLGIRFAPLPGTRVSMCIHETRRSDYAAFASAVPSASAAWKSTAAADNHPVTNVSWEDAAAFCAWLGKKENRRYRLPTDREWSIAVGIAAQESASAPPFKLNGAVAGVYPWSKAKIATVKAGNYAGAGDVYEQTAPVMSFPANELGLFDLGGNVWEYCADLFSPAAATRVLRGASWMDSDPAALLSSCRDPIDPTARSPFVGFRVVLEGAVIHPASSLVPSSSASTPSPAAPVPSSVQRQPATKSAPFINSLGMKFVSVPITGGPTDKKPLLFSIWPTRSKDYQAFITDTRRNWAAPNFQQTPEHPAVLVSWEDARAFCDWLTARERKSGILKAGQVYRLPTDHEWSCGVCIGDKEDASKPPMEKSGKISREFPWGKRWPPPDNAGNYTDRTAEKWQQQNKGSLFKDFITSLEDGYVQTSPVGSFPANTFGLYDMGGNVWNWCEDVYSPDRTERTMRGAAWFAWDEISLLSSNRIGRSPTAFYDTVGFRCVLDETAFP